VGLGLGAGAGTLALLLVVASPARGAGIGSVDSGKILLADAGGDAKISKDSGPISATPPDPTPMEDRRQWVIDFRWEKGEVFLVGVRKVDLEAPRTTPRVMGRFALELFEGKALVERVRFDFPGLIDGDFTDAGYRDPPRLDRKLTTRIGVMFPRTSRGTRLELWDRATDRRWPLSWPLE
jgi:hypothetical protein